MFKFLFFFSFFLFFHCPVILSFFLFSSFFNRSFTILFFNLISTSLCFYLNIVTMGSCTPVYSMSNRHGSLIKLFFLLFLIQPESPVWKQVYIFFQHMKTQNTNTVKFTCSILTIFPMQNNHSILFSILPPMATHQAFRGRDSVQSEKKSINMKPRQLTIKFIHKN